MAPVALVVHQQEEPVLLLLGDETLETLPGGA